MDTILAKIHTKNLTRLFDQYAMICYVDIIYQHMTAYKCWPAAYIQNIYKTISIAAAVLVYVFSLFKNINSSKSAVCSLKKCNQTDLSKYKNKSILTRDRSVSSFQFFSEKVLRVQ